MANLSPPMNVARRPRGVVTLNGASVPFLSGSSDQNAFFEADTFKVELAMRSLPAANDVTWIAAQDSLEVRLGVGEPSDPSAYGAEDVDTLITGRADEVEYDFTRGLIVITGRDHTADLIDTKTSAKYANQTSSQIATTLAQAHGLTAVVKATKTLAGTYYKQDNVKLQDEKSEWELLTFLAKQEGFVAYVVDKELHFEPAPDGTASAGTYDVLVSRSPSGLVTANGSVVKVSHALTLARDIKVEVRSWDRKGRKRYVGVAQATRHKNAVTSGAGKSSTPVQLYSFTKPGLTPAQCTEQAQKKLAELSRHELRLRMEGPADTVLSIRHVLALRGTGSSFDQTYFPDSITRTLKPDGGLTWVVQAKNHSVESQPDL